MSDRRRRWICQFLFIGLCVLPTAWVLLRIAYRPQPAHYAQQLQLQLGVPVTIEKLATPHPDLTLLQGVRLWHPESGTWAIADQWAIWSGPLHTGPRWQISSLQVQEESLGDFLDQLHRSVVRLGPRTAAAMNGGARNLPTLHVQNLEVVSGRLRTGDGPSGMERASNPVLALRLKEVALTCQWSEERSWPRWELAAKLLPPRGSDDLFSAGRELPSVPLLCYLERRPLTSDEPQRDDYLTHWELAALKQPVPLTWWNLSTWPGFLRQRSGANWQGLLSGTLAERHWSLDCRQANLQGLDLSDLEYFFTGQRTETQAAMQLQIHHLGWSGTFGGTAQWEACDLELRAGAGQLAKRLIDSATQALAMTERAPLVRPVSFHAGLPPAAAVHFAELNVGVRLRDGQLWLRPLDSAGQPLPILCGPNGQSQVHWPEPLERPWQMRPSVDREVAQAAYWVPESEAPLGPATHDQVRQPLEIAAIDVPWKAGRFIEGVLVPDPFPFTPVVAHGENEPAGTAQTEAAAQPPTVQTIRSVIEDPRLGAESGHP